ncbi:FtsK/SpoIIIE domain-containing protein [Rothia mucilaginosa]|uniref:FtsK/SpoIIIE domain-containing protein n=1 Tax=Rothia mucilaginosa TaxID=43675 RepID=UPI0026F2DC91|nr:FtsK/SpoIIIE domain-containing protein [Rothia mucilaginosa]
MTLFFLDHHNTTDALPYPRVIRLDGEAAPNGVQLQPAHASDGSSLEQALNQALQQSETGASLTAKDTPFQLFPVREGAELENPQNTSENGASERIVPECNILGGNVPIGSKTPEAPAVSVLRILRGPDAGASFPISRGRTSLGRAALGPRGGEQPRHIHLQDPFLKPVHGSFYADSSGIRWIEKRPSASEGSEKVHGGKKAQDGKKMQSAEPRVLRWDEPFRLGSSLCVLTSPTGQGGHIAEKASATAATPGSSPGEPSQTLAPLGDAGNPFEPVVVNPPAPRKLKQILLSVCLPIVVGLIIVLVTGMWFLLLMSAASSLLMLLHFFGGRAENRAASQQTRQAAAQEKERALALATAGDLAISGPSALYDAAYPAIVLGCGPRQPYLRGRNLPLGTLEKLDAPHYLPLPAPSLGHYLKLEEAHLRAYLVQLVAGYPGAVHVLLDRANNADQQRTNSLLQTLAVLPGVSVHCLPGAHQEKYLQALQSSLQSELSASVPPLILMPQHASAVYAPLLTALTSGATAESSHSRAFSSPREQKMNAPALCVLGSAEGENSANTPGALFGASWVECASEGSHRQSIRYRAHGYSAPPVQPTEGVYQVHPLACEGLCQHADGLSVKSFCAALENLYRAGCEQEQGALNEAQVHQSAHLFSSLQRQSAQQKNRADDMAVESVLQRWSAQRYASDIRCYLGVSSGGLLNIGLSEHGPHWLLGGTTGAGKSQLLRSLVLSATLRYPPERLGLILVDFKGSAGLGPLAQLPHALSVLSNFDVSAVERALEFLRADIHRREVDLQALGVNSYRDYLASCQAAITTPRYPELLIVVDEFRMLIDSMPDAMAELMRIATIGRSLGLHLVLATQRPQGAISQDIRANIATSICLRVASAQDSYNLLEHESAAYISAAHPGAGYVRLPDGRSLPFRAPLVDAVPSNSDARPVQVLGLEEGGWRELTAASAVQPLGGNEDELLIRSAQQIRALYEREYAPKSLQKNAAVQDEYCPIPPELPENTPLPVVEAPVSEPVAYGIDPAATSQVVDSKEPANSGTASEGYLLGELEIARYGVRRPISWSGQQTLALLAQSAERAPMLYGLLAQAFAARTPVVLLTSDGALYRDLEPYAGAFETLVGAQELSHLRFCLEELRTPNLWGTEATTRPLIVVDGLDSWLEALVRQPDTENLLYDLLSQGCRRGYSVVFTSALNPRGRFAATAHSTLLSRRFLDADLMRSTSKDYPTPAQSHYCVEGAINEELIGDQPLSASILSPCVAGFQELVQVLRGNAASASNGSSTRPGTLLRQFPEYYRMPSTEYVTAAHAACNPQGAKLLVAFDRRQMPVWLSAPAGAVVPVQGSRSAGKSTLLESIARLNPQLSTLVLEGSGGASGAGGASGEPPSVERTRALLDSVTNPAHTLVLIDDLQYLQPAVQQLLLERRGEFRAMLVAYTPWPRRASSPLLAALMGCSRALLLAPASLADADMCTVTALPLDRFTQGEQPAGRLVVVDGASVCAAQVPLTLTTAAQAVTAVQKVPVAV